MRLADGILLVTRPGKTAKRQLQRALEAVEQSKLLGALVNGSREAALEVTTTTIMPVRELFYRQLASLQNNPPNQAVILPHSSAQIG